MILKILKILKTLINKFYNVIIINIDLFYNLNIIYMDWRNLESPMNGKKIFDYKIKEQS